MHAFVRFLRNGLFHVRNGFYGTERDLNWYGTGPITTRGEVDGDALARTTHEQEVIWKIMKFNIETVANVHPKSRPPTAER